MKKCYNDITDNKYQILVNDKSDISSLSHNVFKHTGKPINFPDNPSFPFYFTVKTKLERYKGNKPEYFGSDEVIYTASVYTKQLTGYKVINAKDVVV